MHLLIVYNTNTNTNNYNFFKVNKGIKTTFIYCKGLEFYKYKYF